MRRRLILTAALAAIGCSDKKGDGAGGAAAVDESAARAKTEEATATLREIADGARAYYMELHIAPGEVDAEPAQFPRSVDTTPPLGSCCKAKNGACPADPKAWETPAWQALEVSIDEPHRYSYSFTRAADGKSFTARAFGDLDCDGAYSTFELRGTARGEDVELGEIRETDGLE